MTCDKFLALTSLYLDNMLSEKETTEFEKHMADCSQCADEFNDFKDFISKLNTLPEIDLPEGFHERAMEKLKDDVHMNPKQSFNLFSMFKSYTPAVVSAFVCFIFLSAVFSEINKSFYTTGTPSIVMEQYSEDSGSAAPRMLTESSILLNDEDYPESAEIMQEAAPFEIQMDSIDEKDNTFSEEQFQLDDTENPRVHSIQPAYEIPKEDFQRKNLTGLSNEYLFESGNIILIKSVSLSLETENLDNLEYTISTLPANIESTSFYAGESYFSLRVPLERYDLVLSALEDTGTVVYKSEFSLDVTKFYHDAKARLDTKTLEKERLEQLYQKADTIEDMLKIESSISNAAYDIEALKSELLSYDRDYGSPSVYLSAYTKQADKSEEEPFNRQFKNAFFVSVNDTVTLSEELLVFLATASVPAVFVIASLLFISFFYRKRRK